MMKQRHFRIKPNKTAETVHVCVCDSERMGKENPVVIFSHGFTVDGTESHRMFLQVTETFVKHDIACVLFDYRGCGYSSGSFKNFCPSQEVQDLLAVYKFVLEDPNVPKGSLGLLGQSHGSYIGLLAAPHMPLVKAICLWGASVCPLARYTKNLDSLPKYKGLIVLGKGFLLSPQFLGDMAKWDAFKSSQNITFPIVFIHAGADDKVPVKEGKQAYETVKSRRKHFKLIEGANHSFKGQPELQEQAVAFSLDWFKKYLK